LDIINKLYPIKIFRAIRISQGMRNQCIINVEKIRHY